MRDDLPTGTVTFLFTDVEGSTRLLHELGADEYAEALSEHRRIVRDACAAEGGVEVDTQGCNCVGASVPLCKSLTLAPDEMQQPDRALARVAALPLCATSERLSRRR